MNPDDALLVIFKTLPILNPARTAQEGRPIYEDVEHCEIRGPGSRNTTVQPAHQLSTGWVIDPITGEQRQITYAERFNRQYRQFKEHATQTKSGTPLAHVPFLTEARRAELRALNIITVEQLALVDGQELKNLGPGGREYKNKAQEYLSDATRGAPSSVMIAELEALRAKNAILQEDLAAERQRKVDTTFDDMSDEQLTELIKSNTGHAPQGMLTRKTLLRMATDMRKPG
jgi:hypothetical protein